MTTHLRARRCHLLALALGMTTALGIVPLLGSTAAAMASEGDDPGAWADVALIQDADPVVNPARAQALTLPDGVQRPFTVEDPSWSITVLGVSASGDRLATYEIEYDRSEAPVAARLAVRDTSGALVRVIASSTSTFTNGMHRHMTVVSASLSPSGEQVAWLGSDVTAAGGQGPLVVRRTAVVGGPISAIPGASGVRGFIDEELVVVATSPSGADLATAGADATLTPIIFSDGGPAAWSDLSRDGSRVAFDRRVPGSEFDQQIFTAPVQRVGRVITVGQPVLLTPDPVTPQTFWPRSPMFTHDDADVVFLQGEVTGRGGSLGRAPADGGGEALTIPASTRLSWSVGSTQLGAQENSPPAPPVTAQAVRAGARATVSFTVPADPTASFVVATRTSPGLPPKQLRALVSQPLIDTGIVAGRTYTYSLRQLDRSGNTSSAVATALRQSASAAAVRVSGQQLTAGQLLRSTNGVRLRVNPDGNLVALSPRGNVLFQTRTRGSQPVLRVKADGNLVLLSGSRVLWHSRTADQGSAALVAQDDGNVVLYRDSDGKAVWSTRSGRTY